MMTIIANLRETARKRSAYRRTLAELQSLPVDTALDLDLYPGDADKIARAAIYGV